MVSKKYLYFCALGGLGEIGLNSSIYGYGTSIHDGNVLLVDLGIKFASQDFPGFDIIVPNVEWIRQNHKRIKALLLTHAHEDHIGALPYLWDYFENIRIYGSKFTIETVRDKLHRSGKDASNLVAVQMHQELKLDQNFRVTFVNITHSIPQATMLVINTPSGKLVHTGDWKIDETPVVGHPFDHERLQNIGKDQILAMLCDSTNVNSKGFSGSEMQVKKEILQNLKICTGRIVLTCFASNISRIQVAIDLAKSLKRKILIIGHSFKKFVQIAKVCGMLSEIDTVIVTEGKKLPANKLLILCSGSQGESTGSLLHLSENTHPDITLSVGDTVVFSSRVIPGNEKRFYAMQNAFADKHIDILSLDDFCTHVSGHPYEGELRLVYQYINPKIAVPVHGESVHLSKHAKLAKEEGTKYQFVLKNGDVLCLDSNPPKVVEHINIPPMLKYGSDFIRIDSPLIQERSKLLHGFINIILLFNQSGYLDSSPILVTLGLSENQVVLENEILLLLDSFINSKTHIESAFETKIKRTLNNYFKHTFGIMPIIMVTVIN